MAGGLGSDLTDAGEGDEFVRGDVVNLCDTAIGGGQDILYLGPGNDNSLGDRVGNNALDGGVDPTSCLATAKPSWAARSARVTTVVVSR